MCLSLPRYLQRHFRRFQNEKDSTVGPLPSDGQSGFIISLQVRQWCVIVRYSRCVISALNPKFSYFLNNHFHPFRISINVQLSFTVVTLSFISLYFLPVCYLHFSLYSHLNRLKLYHYLSLSHYTFYIRITLHRTLPTSSLFPNSCEIVFLF